MTPDADRCQICLGDDSREITVTKEDGGVIGFVCEACISELQPGPECSVCRNDASGEYQMITDGWDAPSNPLCSDCRRLMLFDNTPPVLNRLREMGITRFRGGGSE